MTKTYLHVDLDAFFASVEQRDHPEYRGKPLIVGGLPGDKRAVVSTASYEARKFGVHSAMPLSQAVRLCPNGIFIRGNHKLYQQVSRQIMEIFYQYSPDVIQMSIDEAFIDITGTERIYGSPEELALNLKNQVHKYTGLTVSVGISSSMYVAKIASGYKKPDGLTIIPDGQEEAFMLSLSLEKVWGLGKASQKRIKQAGFKSCRQIYECPLKLLISIFGENMGQFLFNALRGNKEMLFGTEAKNHSISTETTFEEDLTERYVIDSALMELSQNVLYRMRCEKVRSRTIAVKIRYDDFTTVSVQETFELPVLNEDDLFEKAKRLFQKKYIPGRGIRLLGIAAEKVEGIDSPMQKDFFNEKNEKKARLEEAIFNLKKKHPEINMQKARLIKNNKND